MVGASLVGGSLGDSADCQAQSASVDGVARVDRTSFVVPPSAADPKTKANDDGETKVAKAQREFADVRFGDEASAGWKSYVRLWREFSANPDSVAIRRYLGLPQSTTARLNTRRGRSAPSWLGWRAGTYQQIDSPHFSIYTRAPAAESRRVTEDLERCYWIWTQMFFPLWEGSAQVSGTLSSVPPTQSLDAFLQTKKTARISIRRKMRVVLFRNAAEYKNKLSPVVPGVERSTGFYSDDNQTIFLYASENDDAATRRHEVVHQLFREATRSQLGNGMPAEQSGFWLVEGIAGYFESLDIGPTMATVGGWDSSRLQYARYRVLAGRDMMPMPELTNDGRQAVQRRQDIARFYAHAIAQTHHLLDGGDHRARQWIYKQLADTYRIKTDLPSGRLPQSPERELVDFLKITDPHVSTNPNRAELKRLCLVDCLITGKGLSNITPSASLDWLDLSRIGAAGNQTVARLAPNPASVTQLSLEQTGIDAGLDAWLSKASNLQEIDLSFTRVGDSAIAAIAKHPNVEVLWMTGSQVTDESIDTIARMRKLSAVDLQRTQVSNNGIARLKQLRPQLQINPLELR